MSVHALFPDWRARSCSGPRPHTWVPESGSRNPVEAGGVDLVEVRQSGGRPVCFREFGKLSALGRPHTSSTLEAGCLGKDMGEAMFVRFALPQWHVLWFFMPFQSAEQETRRGLILYALFGSQQLFRARNRGYADYKQCVVQRIVRAIFQAYRVRGIPSSLGIRAHTTRDAASSKALLYYSDAAYYSLERKHLGLDCNPCSLFPTSCLNVFLRPIKSWWCPMQVYFYSLMALHLKSYDYHRPIELALFHTCFKDQSHGSVPKASTFRCSISLHIQGNEVTVITRDVFHLIFLHFISALFQLQEIIYNSFIFS